MPFALCPLPQSWLLGSLFSLAALRQNKAPRHLSFWLACAIASAAPFSLDFLFGTACGMVKEKGLCCLPSRDALARNIGRAPCFLALHSRPPTSLNSHAARAYPPFNSVI